MHSIKEFTRDKLKKMEASGGPPVNVDRDADARADDYGFTEARSSNSAKFKHGGHAEHGKKPHMGRAGRATGGRAPTHNITKPTIEPIHMQDNVKLRARGGKASHPDEREDRELVHKMVKKEALSGEKKGGRVHRKDGGGMRSEGARDAEDEEKMSRMSGGEKEEMANERRGGRIHRARGGKAKGKTVVNVIVGAGHDQPPQAPAMMAPPPPPPPAPMPPPRPPMAPPGGGMMPPGGMPIGGAPMGAAGAPPGGMPMRPPMPGGMPMRARGGKVSEPHEHFGTGGTRAKAKMKEEFGGGGGEGRLEKARREGAHYRHP